MLGWAGNVCAGMAPACPAGPCAPMLALCWGCAGPAAAAGFASSAASTPQACARGLSLLLPLFLAAASAAAGAEPAGGAGVGSAGGLRLAGVIAAGRSWAPAGVGTVGDPAADRSGISRAGIWCFGVPTVAAEVSTVGASAAGAGAAFVWSPALGAAAAPATSRLGAPVFPRSVCSALASMGRKGCVVYLARSLRTITGLDQERWAPEGGVRVTRRTENSTSR